jgi:hypothetical protein
VISTNGGSNESPFVVLSGSRLVRERRTSGSIIRESSRWSAQN